ncbi:hypothetical protein [Rhodoblastus sp.]|jgi:hypothetical protein|uniref:hypothetical protein n=1 Tax=Rhodoblastus sp. TaxID=1962975 RepID=UPI00260D3F93|nr:hypothetical protein [Rhodoblastus sp.]
MASDSGLSLRRGVFERVLEQLESQEGAEARIAPPWTEARLWPRLSEPPAKPVQCPETIAAAYAAHDVGDEHGPPPPQRLCQPEADIVSIRREISAARHVQDLRILRRRCALLAHPDRLSEPDRAMAEKFMAEINAAIDRAIQDRSEPRQRP